MSPSGVDGAYRTSSDYGSDIGLDDDTELSELLEEIEVRHRAHPPLVVESLEDNVSIGYAIVPFGRDSESSVAEQVSAQEQWNTELDDESLCLDASAGTQTSYRTCDLVG